MAGQKGTLSQLFAITKRTRYRITQGLEVSHRLGEFC